MKRRDLDGCPIAGALQMVGDKWTMLIIRELVHGPKRTMAIHAKLEGLSSRTLVARLKDLGKDRIVVRKDSGGNPPHIEYTLTARGRLLLPLLDALRETGQVLGCYESRITNDARASIVQPVRITARHRSLISPKQSNQSHNPFDLVVNETIQSVPL